MPPTRMRHRGDKINDKGRVSALCFPTPRAIDMKRATEWPTWTPRVRGVPRHCRELGARVTYRLTPNCPDPQGSEPNAVLNGKT